jgi:RalA-binding protein 1
MMPSRAGSGGPPPAPSAAYLTKVASDGISALPNYLEKDRDRKAKSGRFWPSFNRPAAMPEKPLRPVFAVPLTESLAIASVANLPAIVFRCIEYLEAKKAETEEGIYRLSGSSAVIKGLKDRFDHEGDVKLLQVDELWDPHAIAGLLKTFLRDLPTSPLTRDLHPRFLAVMGELRSREGLTIADLIDSSARVAELSRLISDLPPPNYALLRALTAHLILIVANSALNKMTLRNIGIVFSPTLGIPAGIFSELVSHFGAIFDDEPEEPIGGVGEDGSLLRASSEETEETVRRKRNSMLYQAGGADAMLGLAGRALDPGELALVYP